MSITSQETRRQIISEEKRKAVLKLWSYINSPAKGWHWHMEHVIDNNAGDLALDVARHREPDIFFVVSGTKPKGVPS